MSLLFILLVCGFEPCVVCGACVESDDVDLVGLQSMDVCDDPFTLDDYFGVFYQTDETLSAGYVHDVFNTENGRFYMWPVEDDGSASESPDCADSVVDEGQRFVLKKGRCSWGSDAEASCARARERRQALLKDLRAGVVSWCAKKDVYNNQRGVFYVDILNLMRFGCDIQKQGEGFQCFGQIDLHTCRPEKHVALAMFDALMEGVHSRFDVAFELSLQGYRYEGIYCLISMEAAFVVAGVHPRRTQINAQGGEDVTQYLRDLWDDVRSMERKHFAFSLSQTTAYYRTIIYQLRMLRDENVLDTLQAKKEELVRSDVWLCARKELLRNVVGARLNEQKNTPIKIKDLLENVNFSFKRKGGKPMPVFAFRNVVLDLAFDGVPLVYNRADQTMMVVGSDLEVPPQPSGTNILTAVYDCSCQAKKGLSVHETAYTVYTRGYWRKSGRLNAQERADLLREVLWIKKVLAILDFVSIDTCGTKDKPEVTRQRQIWRAIQTDGGTINDLLYYQENCECAVTQEDVDAAAHIQKFVFCSDYAVLDAYIASKEVQDPQLSQEELSIKNFLIGGGLTDEDLWKKYQGAGFKKKKKEYWKMLTNLTEKKGQGRVIFDLKKGVFLWDEASVFQEKSSEGMAAELFGLRSWLKMFGWQVLSFVMHQRGFKGANKQKMERLTVGLRVLGLWLCKSKLSDFAEQRQLLNALIVEEGLSKNHQGAKSAKIWGEDAIQRMASWHTSGAMAILWEAYLQERRQENEAPPQAKYLKLEEENACPEKIIEEKIPALKAFLVSKKLWVDPCA